MKSQAIIDKAKNIISTKFVELVYYQILKHKIIQVKNNFKKIQKKFLKKI